MEAQMNTEQYNAIMDQLRMLGTKFDHLDTRLGNLEQKVEHIDTRLGNLEQKVGGLEKEMRASHQSAIRWVMGLFVAALLVNGPVIGAIVSVVILKMV